MLKKSLQLSNRLLASLVNVRIATLPDPIRELEKLLITAPFPGGLDMMCRRFRMKIVPFVDFLYTLSINHQPIYNYTQSTCYNEDKH